MSLPTKSAAHIRADKRRGAIANHILKYVPGHLKEKWAEQQINRIRSVKIEDITHEGKHTAYNSSDAKEILPGPLTRRVIQKNDEGVRYDDPEYHSAIREALTRER